MYRILAGTGPELELRRKRRLVALVLVVQRPGAHAPAQDCTPLSRDPLVVVRARARARRGMEEELVAVRECDVHDGGPLRRALEPRADEAAQLPGGLCGEAREYAALLLGSNGD